MPSIILLAVQGFKKVYCYFFYQINNLFKHSLDSYNEHKAAILIGLLETILITKIVDLTTNYEILENYDWLLLEEVFISISIAFFNYYLFIEKKWWKKFEKEFKLMTNQQKLLANLGIVVFFIFFTWFVFVL